MSEFLLLDFGASRIKTAICDLEEGGISNLQDFPPITPSPVTEKEEEIPLAALKDQFFSICNHYHQKLNLPFEGIVLCSQMHGFAALDPNDQPLTNYISWQDERSSSSINGIDTFSLIKKELKDKFKEITGMNPRPCWPFMNALHLARENKIKGECKIISLPEWLAGSKVAHPSMLAGLGLYDIKSNQTSGALVKFAEKIAGVKFNLNSPATADIVAGYWNKIPIYAGVGDLQCAVLGAGNTLNQSLSINIGTGSQVSMLTNQTKDEGLELRPFFDDLSLKTITHIPAGRIISQYLQTLSKTHPKIDFWSLLKEIPPEEIKNAPRKFELGIFESAWNFRPGAKIVPIEETKLDLKKYLAVLLKSFTSQYLEAIKLVDAPNNSKLYVFSGGIPKKLPNLVEFIKKESQKEVFPPADIDETFLGLRSLALVAAKKARKTREAQKLYGRAI